jgi:Protein of unknown function (DUF3224)
MQFHLLLALIVISLLQPQPPRSNAMHHATGTFEVKIAPLEPVLKDDATISRFSADKQFHGALDGAGHGEMLSTGNPAADAGAVAMEKVTGKLDGRSGSFVLLHHGIMVGGKPQHWTITVVPGSGTGELQGIGGTMQIVIEAGKHSYVLDYTLPEK